MSVGMRCVVGGWAALVLAAGLAACGGGGGGGARTPAEPDSGTAYVWVEVPAGATFYGFDIALTYDASRLTALTPLESAVQSSDLGAGATCQALQAGSNLRLACVSNNAMRGPGRIARFGFLYGLRPVADAYGLTCAFVDADGNPVAVSCVAELQY